MRVRGPIVALLLALAAGCAPDPTEALVSVDVAEPLRADLVRLELIVEVPAEDGGMTIVVQEPVDDPVLPYVLALVPRDGDAGRTWSVEAQAVGTMPGDVTVRRLRGGYREDAVTRFDLLIEPCAMPCAAGSYCLDLACAPGVPR